MEKLVWQFKVTKPGQECVIKTNSSRLFRSQGEYWTWAIKILAKHGITTHPDSGYVQLWSVTK